jgi:hypothetical protein
VKSEKFKCRFLLDAYGEPSSSEEANAWDVVDGGTFGETTDCMKPYFRQAVMGVRGPSGNTPITLFTLQVI